jgi:SPP1 gp7 family putative phage head morphogenesis protein
MSEIKLKPIKETTEDFERLEAAIIELFRTQIYLPLIKSMGRSQRALTNAADDLLEALRSGRVTFYRGTFSGRFNSVITQELKRLGAQWERKTGTFKLPQSSLSVEIRNAVASSEARFQERMAGIDRKLAQILPEEIAGKLQAEKFFDSSLWKVDRDFKKTVQNITVAPQLSDEARKRIATEWQTNMRLWIKDFTKVEIEKLRKDLQKSVFTGNRYGSAVKTIQKSYGVSRNKAKFLARQETSLLMTKFKETRYTEAGVNEYRWRCVSGSKDHPVRPWHKSLDGKLFRWDDPPITTKPGEAIRRNNPGQDFNCRCFAQPIVRF